MSIVFIPNFENVWNTILFCCLTASVPNVNSSSNFRIHTEIVGRSARLTDFRFTKKNNRPAPVSR